MTVGRNELEIIRGSITAVLYQNEANGYTVVRFETETEETITVVGTIPLSVPGERLVVTGDGRVTVPTARSFMRSFWSA